MQGPYEPFQKFYAKPGECVNMNTETVAFIFNKLEKALVGSTEMWLTTFLYLYKLF